MTPATVVPSATLPSVLTGFSSVSVSASTGTSSMFAFSSSAMLLLRVVVDSGIDDIAAAVQSLVYGVGFAVLWQ